MKQFGFTLITIIFLGALGYGGYFAVTSLKDPKTYVSESYEKIGDIQRVATSTNDGSEQSVYERTPVLNDGVSATTTASVSTSITAPAPGTPAKNESELVTRLEKLIASGVVLKKGSKGEYVGTVQLFMNFHFKKQSKIDNDFGAGLETDVKKFQTANKISATGQVGPQTLKKMLELAKK